MRALLIGLLCILPFAGSAQAQTVGHAEVTVGGQPLDHLRPGTWQPLQADVISVSGEGIEVDYSVTFTNSLAGPLTFASMRGFAPAPYVNGGAYSGGSPCWGIDFSTADYTLQLTLPAPVTLGPGESVTLAGSGSAPSVSWFGAPYSGWFCVVDGLHGSTQLNMGPPAGYGITSWRAGAGPGGTIFGVDNGSVVTSHDFTIVTQYALTPVGTPGCQAPNPNGSGQVGMIEAFGVAHAAAGDSLLRLRALNLPIGSVAMPILGLAGQSPTPLGTGLGALCISGVQRWTQAVALTDSGGVYSTMIDSEDLAPLVGTVAPGSTLHFQVWHRDVSAGQATSNATGSVIVELQ